MSALNVLFYLMMGSIVYCLYAAYKKNLAIHRDMLRELEQNSMPLKGSSSVDANDDKDRYSTFFHTIRLSEEETHLHRLAGSNLHLVRGSREESLNLIGDGRPRAHIEEAANESDFPSGGHSAIA